MSKGAVDDDGNDQARARSVGVACIFVNLVFSVCCT